MSIPGSAESLLLTQQDTGYRVERSIRLNSADSAFLSRTPASAGNRKTWTWAGWVKLTKNTSQQYIFGGTQDNYNVLWTLCSFYQDKIYLQSYSGGFQFNFQTTQVFRDYSAWYHIVVAVDTTQATNTDRVKLYVNGTQVTSYVTASYPSQNVDTLVNGNWLQTISGSLATTYLDAYLADIHFIDGQALTPSSFAETNTTTGQWVPKAYSGTFTGNSFWLKFADNSAATATTLGKDSSGLGNNWTPNNLSVTAGAGNDSLVDTPTSYGTGNSGGDVRGNFCVINPLDKNTNISLANGNLDVSLGAVSAWYSARATFGVSSGKWYWEVLCNAVSGANPRAMIGIMTAQASVTSFVGSDSYGWGYYNAGGSKYTGGAGLSYGASYSTNDVIGIAFDADAGSIAFYLNGASQGVAYSGLAANTYFPAIGLYSETSASVTFNFGQRPFAYTAPSGFKALCDTNLPAPVVAKPNQHFDVVLRNGGAGSYTTTVNMSNGALLWDKPRNQASGHYLFDSLRGISKNLRTDSTQAEATDATWITSFNSNSFTTGSSDWGGGVSIVDWIWAAGSQVTNTQGSITSQVRANASAGFSIVTFTTDGTTKTVGHGLGVKPSLVIVKSRNVAGSWLAITDILGSMQYGVLNSTAAFASIGYSAPTSTVFQYNDNNGNTQVAYCFAPVAGYSAMGSYVGNGTTNRNFIFTGFIPKTILVKKTNASGTNWRIIVPKTVFLSPNTSDSEYDGPPGPITPLANGFEIFGGADINNSGDTYIYCAWAESPLQYARAR